MVEDDAGADVEGFAGGESDMGEADAVGGCQEWMGGWEGRFLFVDVDGGARKTAFGECVGEGRNVDDVAPGGVDEECGGFEERESLAADEVTGFGSEWEVEGDDVALAEEGVEVGVAGAEGFDFRVTGAVVGKDVAAEGEEESDDGGADGARAYDADGFAVEFAAEDVGAAFEAACGGVEGCDAAEEVEHEAYGEFADGDGGVACGVLDLDVVLTAVVEVDVVEACEGYGEVAEARAASEDCGGEGDVGDGDDVGVVHPADEGLGVFMPVHIITEIMPLSGKFSFQGLESILGDAQRFNAYDVHCILVSN